MIVLDLGLPRVDGVGVARKIRAADMPIRILALSIYADPALVRSLVEIGVDGYLMKEEAPELIVEAVRGIVNGEQGWYSHKVISTLAGTIRGKDSPQLTLTQREQEVIRLVSQGKTNQEIAYSLGVSESTIEKNMRNICKKLEANSQDRGSGPRCARAPDLRNSLTAKAQRRKGKLSLYTYCIQLKESE